MKKSKEMSVICSPFYFHSDRCCITSINNWKIHQTSRNVNIVPRLLTEIYCSRCIAVFRFAPCGLVPGYHLKYKLHLACLSAQLLCGGEKIFYSLNH